MCGICGSINFDPDEPADSGLLDRMCQALAHRGPDACGSLLAGPVALGHRRLSIIDLSDAARQPLANEDGSVQVVCNGEIYNFAQLRQQLEQQGHRFRSGSDSEVIVHLYEEQGSACVTALRGMFAFALWDQRQQLLMLARDRVGKKPLVYRQTARGLQFASEIKALLEAPDLPREIDHRSLHDYLTYQYVPGPGTIFSPIRKLPPAHIMLIQNGRVRTERYWQLSYGTAPALPVAQAAAQLREQVTEAVRIRLRSDVPLGAFLSGGIDSSIVVGLMQQLLDQPVKTFSIGFEHEHYNELPYARRVAQLFGTEHTEFVVKPAAVDILPRLVRCYDEPFADPSAIPTYYVAEMTRQHVTVALTGDGGDESFAGYQRYAADRLAAWYGRLPGSLRHRLIEPLVARLPYRDQRWSTIRRLKRLIGGTDPDPARRYVNWLCYFTGAMKHDLYTADLRRLLGGIDSTQRVVDLYARAGAASAVDRMLFADVMLYLPYDLLVKTDIATMAHALEARSPLLDHQLMEFAAALPASMKLRGLTTKYLLKRAFADLLPRDITHRRKMGFGVPLAHWLRNDLQPALRDLLCSVRARQRGWFRPTAVERMIDDHVHCRADHSYRLWSLLWLEVWCRTYLDRSGVPGI